MTVYRRGSKSKRENALETWAVKWARTRKIVVAKLTECAGVPDRVFFLPGKCVLIIEFKKRGEKPEELQEWYLNKLLEYHHDVGWCDSKEGFLEAMRQRGII